MIERAKLSLPWLAAMLIPMIAAAEPIDRHVLVTRNSPAITQVDASSPFMVGNGSIAFTADITGLQTFQEQYSPLVPLMTQAQWAWHSFPNPKGFKIEDALVPFDIPGGTRKYPALRKWDEARAAHIQWLRENPHRFNLARLGLHLLRADGGAAAFADLKDTRQSLDLWNGVLVSQFTLEGEAVRVETSVHPERDVLIVRIDSALIGKGRLGVDLRFPGVGPQLNPDPTNWTIPDSHQTREVSRGARTLVLRRQIDDTRRPD